MKRLVLTLVAGLLVLPIAHAQDWDDMSNDANAIRQEQRNIWHDRQEQREDLERGDYGAAAREQQEINQRRWNQNAIRQDLNNDWANRYYGYRHYRDDDDD